MVRPNKYEKGRAHIIVLNFDKSSTVSVDLSNSGLTGGQNYEIRDAQNFYGSPVVTGTYNGGSITLPMTQTSTAQMINYSTPPHTSSEFGVFVVLPTSGSTSSAPAAGPGAATRANAERGDLRVAIERHIERRADAAAYCVGLGH